MDVAVHTDIGVGIVVGWAVLVNAAGCVIWAGLIRLLFLLVAAIGAALLIALATGRLRW